MGDSHGLSHIFSILLKPPRFHGLAGMSSGTMLLGGVHRDMYSGGLACIPTLPLARRVNASANDLNPQGVPVNNTAWWQIEIVQVRVGTKEFPAAQGIVDTGTSLLIIPRT